MTVTKKKVISKEKECFLAICLLAGELSPETANFMKKDIGVKKFNNRIVKKLVDKKYVIRNDKNDAQDNSEVDSDNDLDKRVVKTRKPSFRITLLGTEYLRTKLPDKYNYGIYRENRDYVYKSNRKERAQQLSLVLYVLYREGISIENHADEFNRILHGESVDVETPFFVSMREVRKMDVRFESANGARLFGFIVTSNKIIAVYNPDKEHHLPPSLEPLVLSPIQKLLEYAKEPYCNSRNFEFLYLFKSYDDIVNSFTIEDNRINKSASSTKRVYLNNRLKNSYIYPIFNSPYCLLDLLDNDIRAQVEDIFWQYYDLEPNQLFHPNYLPINSLYEGRYPTAICWDLNPGTLLSVAEYCKYEVKKKGSVMVACFNEHRKLIEQILSINKKEFEKIDIGSISCKQVFEVIRGESDHID